MDIPSGGRHLSERTSDRHEAISMISTGYVSRATLILTFSISFSKKSDRLTRTQKYLHDLDPHSTIGDDIDKCEIVLISETCLEETIVPDDE